MRLVRRLGTWLSRRCVVSECVAVNRGAVGICGSGFFGSSHTGGGLY